MRKSEKEKSRSIKRTLLIGMTGLTVAVCIICGVANGAVLYSNNSKGMEDETALASSAYSQAVQNKINQYKMSIEQIAANDTITANPMFAVNIWSTKERLAKQYGFTKIYLADETGKTEVDGVSIADRDYFKQAMSGKTCISSPVLSRIDKKQVVYVAAKVNNITDYKGIVFGALSIDTFSSMVDKATIGSSGYSFITDGSGTIIAHHIKKDVTDAVNYIEKGKKDSSLSGMASVVKNMISGKTGAQTVILDGAEQYIHYTPIPDTDGWSLAVSAKKSEMMDGFYKAIGITVGITLLLIILTCLIAFRVATPIANPIVSVVKRIEKLAEGDLHSEVPEICSQNEIGILSKSFSSTVTTLNSYVSEISTVLDSLAAGDCTINTYQDYKGDFLEIKTSLNTIITNLNDIFTRINASAEQVSTSAQQVAGASQALSEGASEQASSIEELSASLTEVGIDVSKNAENAKIASGLSQEATLEVARGNDKMQLMVSAMSDINQSSRQIGKIIKTIEDIAFQTNILALNAAVEAARAGVAGKGFAVVADEVRNLASKSAQAAKNTTALIQTSMNAVDNGTRIADETAKSLQTIIETTRKTSDLITEISEASNKQAISINEINLGVDRISAVVQNNSATSEQSAATSEQLREQAQVLKNVLARLKLQDRDSTTEYAGELHESNQMEAFGDNGNAEVPGSSTSYPISANMTAALKY